MKERVVRSLLSREPEQVEAGKPQRYESHSGVADPCPAPGEVGSDGISRYREKHMSVCK